jgi:hypothetical protein
MQTCRSEARCAMSPFRVVLFGQNTSHRCGLCAIVWLLPDQFRRCGREQTVIHPLPAIRPTESLPIAQIWHHQASLHP